MIDQVKVSLSEEVCSDPENLAAEICNDGWAVEDEIAAAIRFGFTVRDARALAFLERGVRGEGQPTEVFPDWVYEARDAIRRQNENPPHYLPELLAILGWQGGTYHQALRAVQRLVEADKEIELKRADYQKEREAITRRAVPS